VIVVGTFPWYLLPGAEGGAVVLLLRFGRLARLGLVAIKSPAVKNLVRRLGVPALVVAVAVFVAAGIVKHAEGPPEYSTYGESAWWAMVTVTTVGYGDIVPQTTEGRTVAVILMLVGVALLGTVAASLASFFEEISGRREAEASESALSRSDPLEGLQRSLDDVRKELASLRAALGETEPPRRL
jgi:voltage-gated potassium channel